MAVAITAQPISRGERTANPRMARFVVAKKTTMPTRRFQPKWRLGIAAYWFVSAGGCSVRYEVDCWSTVSIRPASMSRGGAIGTSAKKRKPTRPDTNIALRSSR